MFRHIIVIGLRNIRKYWKYALINITGLAIGLVSFIFIILYIQDELEYDKFHENAHRIYRVNRLYNSNNINEDAATCSFPCGPALQEDYPELIEHMVRFFDFQKPEMLIEYKKNEEEIVRYNERWFYLADSTAFEIFTFKLKSGNPTTVLDRPNTIVLSESTAKRYFGEETAIGKSIRLEEFVDLEVTGIMEDIPSQSHFKIDMIGSLSTYRELQGKQIPNSLLGPLTNYRQTREGVYPETWIWNPCWTYVLLHKDVKKQELESKLPEFYTNNYTDFRNQNVTLYLQALTDIHLNSQHVYEMRPNSQMMYVKIFYIIAGIVLFLACINFMNLATAFSFTRVKEIGMKKVFGCARSHLTVQYLGETIVLTAIAMFLGIFIVELFLPVYNQFTGKNILPQFIFEPTALLIILGLILGVGLFSGIYPAFVLASYKPFEFLRGKMLIAGKSLKPRKLLVASQFTISTALIIVTLVVFAQWNYLRNANLGFNKDQIILMKNAGNLLNNFYPFKEELLKHPDIKYVTGMEDVLGVNHNTRAYTVEGLKPEQNSWIPAFLVDWDFIETFDIRIVEGRSFSKEFQEDNLNSVLINETMARNMGWTNREAIGKMVRSQTGNERVIGIFRDFHPLSLRTPINNFIIDMHTTPETYSNIIAVKINTDDYSQVTGYIEEKWNAFVPTRPFEYTFLNEQLNALYIDEERFGRISIMLTLLAIFIAILGLTGLTSFLTRQRRKEICIRRVHGATMSNILWFMLKDYVGLFIMANLISWPVTYVIMNNWLLRYSSSIHIGLWVFLLSAFITVLITLVIIGYQTFRITSFNPAHELRYE